MSHEISITDGVASFADSRAKNGKVDAWHRLGTPVGHAMTAREALDAAYLALWNVRKQPVYTKIDGKEVEIDGKYATVFDNPVNDKTMPIGVVGERFCPIQNESMAEFGDALVDESGSHWETAGSLRSYSQTFMTMKLPKSMVLQGANGTDLTEWYVALFNSHDGSSSMFGITTGIRVVCANTAGAAIRGAQSRFSVRHTKGYKGAVQQAREALKITFGYEEAFEAEAQAMMNAHFDFEEMKEFSHDLLKVSVDADEGDTATRRRNEAGSILKLFVESPAIAGTPIANTRWGAYNAVTEFVDHYQAVRGTDQDRDLLRAARSLSTASQGRGMKVDAFKMLQVA